MTRNRMKVWDLNYVTVIMSETTKPGALATEPIYVDVSQNAPWDPNALAFRDKVTDLAAPIHGKSKYDLARDDVREQRRFRRLRRAAIIGLAMLTVLAVAAASIAFVQRQEAWTRVDRDYERIHIDMQTPFNDLAIETPLAA